LILCTCSLFCTVLPLFLLFDHIRSEEKGQGDRWEASQQHNLRFHDEYRTDQDNGGKRFRSLFDAKNPSYKSFITNQACKA